MNNIETSTIKNFFTKKLKVRLNNSDQSNVWSGSDGTIETVPINVVNVENLFFYNGSTCIF